MGQTMRNEMYTALPLNMGNGNPRNPAAFIYLMPGVQEGGTFGFINGGQSFSKDVYIEGLPITDAVRQGESRALQFAVSVDAVEQFQVETSGQSVEFNGQGSENYTIKSGTNQFHGSRTSTSATPCSTRAASSRRHGRSRTRTSSASRSADRSSGTSIFFFGAYDAYRYRVATDYRFVTVPTMRMRTGDFGELPVADLRSRHYTLSGRHQLHAPAISRQRHSGRPPLVRLRSFSRIRCRRPTHSGIANNFFNNNQGVGFNNANVNVKVDLNAATRIASRCSSRAARTTRAVPSAAIPFRFRCPTWSRALSTRFPTVGQVKHTWVINAVDDEPDQLWRFAALDSDHQSDDRWQLGGKRGH